MNLSNLKAQIKSGNLNSFYIFTGPEMKVCEIYLRELAKSAKSEVKKLTRITDLTQNFKGSSFLKSRSVFVLRDCKEFISDEHFQSLIAQNLHVSDDIIVFVYTDSLDKRSKFYKKYSEDIVEFEYLKPEVLRKYIQKEIPLSDARSDMLVSICEQDYNRILLEMDKIRRYSVVEHCSVDVSMDHLIETGTLYRPPEDTTFKFVDSALRYKKWNTVSDLHDARTRGIPALVLLQVLYNNTRQVLQVQSYSGNAKITDATGLTGFQVKLAKEKMNVYSNGDLVYLLRLIRKVERGIKLGEIEESIALDYVLAQFWG